MDRKSSVLKCIGLIAAYWALILFGPLLVMIWNRIAVWLSGGGFYEGSFGYKILVFLSQPIACSLAHSAAKSISDDNHNICVLVNEIVAVCLLVFLTWSSFFLLNEIINAINYIVSAVVVIIYAVLTAKTLQNPSNT